jgi:hypothetical protein
MSALEFIGFGSVTLTLLSLLSANCGSFLGFVAREAA